MERVRGRGVGSALMEAVEELAAETSDTVCLGVGLHSGYGAAQRMYVLPGDGRHGVRTWVLSTDDGGTIRRIRLSPGEIGCLAGILQTIANKGGRDDEPVG